MTSAKPTDQKQVANKAEVKSLFSKLINACENNNRELFLTLINEAQEDVLNEALALQDDDGWTVFHIAALYQDSAAFRALIAKASAKAINQALVVPSPWGYTLFHRVVRYHDSATLCALIDKASDEAISQASVLISWGESVFHVIARYADSAAFRAFITKASAEAISRALVLQKRLGIFIQEDGWTGFQVVASYRLDSVDFLAVIAKASTEAVDQGLVLQNYDGWTGFHMIARRVSVDFLAVLAKASAKAINQASVLQNNNRWTAFHVAAHNANRASIEALMSKLVFPIVNIDKAIDDLDKNVRLSKSESERLKVLLKTTNTFINNPKDSIRNNPQEFIAFLRNRIDPKIRIQWHEPLIDILRRAISATKEPRWLDMLWAMLGHVDMCLATANSIACNRLTADKKNQTKTDKDYYQLALKSMEKDN